MKSLILLAATLCATSTISAQQSTAARPARVLEVPRGFATVQAAIDSARAGDTVLVSRGRYYENIHFRGRPIVLTSHFAHTRDLRDIEETILDGSRPHHPDSASVVYIAEQEDTTTVLQGFTITGGRGTVWLDAKDHRYFREGGGILCELSAPTIRFNYIVNNEAIIKGDSVLSAGGGGIRCGYAEPTIENNVIRNNRGRYGAGIVLFHSAAIVRNNLIVQNEGGQDFGGSGLWAVGSLSRRLPVISEYNTIADNRSIVEGTRKPQTLQGLAGGVWTTGVRLVFRNNVVWGNKQAELGQFEFRPNPSIDMAANVIENGVDGAPGGHGTLTADPGFVDRLSYALKNASTTGAYAGRGGKTLVRTQQE